MSIVLSQTLVVQIVDSISNNLQHTQLEEFITHSTRHKWSLDLRKALYIFLLRVPVGNHVICPKEESSV